MAKVFTYVILCTGMMLIMNLMGVPTAVDSILAYLGITITGQTIFLPQFPTGFLAILASSAVGGIIIGTLTRSSPESFLIAPFVVLLAVFIGTFASIINYAGGFGDWTSKVVLVLMVPVAIGYGIALIDYWRGTD